MEPAATAFDETQIDAPMHARERVRLSCESIYDTPLADGGRFVRDFVGAEGMADFGATPYGGRSSSSFRCRVTSARYGPITIGAVHFTPHSRAALADNFHHNHPVYRLLIVQEGSLLVEVDGKKIMMFPGSGLLIPGDQRATYTATSSGIRFHLDLSVDEPRFSALLRRARCGFWPDNTSVLLALGAFINSLLQTGEERRKWADRALTRTTVEAIACSLIASTPPDLNELGRTHSVKETALQYIRTHRSDPDLNPITLASALGISQRTLQRAFFGDTNACQWIARYRLEHALDLLADPRFANLSLPAISARAGYGSPATMRRAVINATGLSPASYREMVRAQDS